MTIDLTNLEEETADNNIHEVETSNVEREGSLNNSLEANYVAHNSDVAGLLDHDEVMQVQELEEDSLENGLR